MMMYALVRASCTSPTAKPDVLDASMRDHVDDGGIGQDDIDYANNDAAD